MTEPLNDLWRTARCHWVNAAVLLLVALGTPASLRAAESSTPLFERDVLPILTANCLGCHGGLFQKGGLDLRTIALMTKGSDGPAVKPGDPSGSHLWTAIESGDMPKDKQPLSPADKEVIKRWIAAGLPTVAGTRAASVSDPLLPAGTKHTAAEVAAAIDKHINRALAESGQVAAATSDDIEFLRRIYLDLTGRVPTAAQAAGFLDDRSSDKRAKLIETLLASPEFGEQFGRTWRDWIAPPELPSDPNSGKQPHKETQDLGKWIGDRVHAGDGWDKIAAQLIGAESEIKSNPQVLFLGLFGEGGKTSPAGSARGVASLFLGVQLQCAQCHDDPYRTWSQDDFWALAAFFGKATGDFSKVFEDPPFPKLSDDPKKRMDQLREREKAEQKRKATDPATYGSVVIPQTSFRNAGKRVHGRFLGETTTFTPATDDPYRPVLLAWLTGKDNRFFAPAFANRTWFYFFNRGIVHPVDDFRDLNPPSHPGLIRLLADQFASAGFDVKHLIRCICNSAAYQRTSRPVAGEDAIAAARLVASFGRMPSRVMTADMLYDSLRLAYGDPKLDLRPIDPKDGNTNGESAPVGDAQLEFRRTFCTNEEDTTDLTHGIPQLLTMMNHPRLTAGSKALDAMLKAEPSASAARIVEWLYLSTLSRRPDADEAAAAIAFVGDGDPAARGKRYASLLWVLVNRSEYLLVR